VDRVDDALEPVHVRRRALAEVGSLRVPPADEAVAVLDGSLFPRCVGARVVDVASDDGLDLLRVEELASVVGIMGNAGQANYTASKGGVIALTKTTAKELGSRNIRCNAVAPGFIQSKMTDVLPDDVKKAYMDTIPLKRFGTAEDIAKAVAWLAGDESAYVTGQIISVNGGMIG